MSIHRSSNVESSMHTAFFTIATKSHLSYARVILGQVRRYYPDASVFLILVDEPDGYFDPEKESFKVIPLSQVIQGQQWIEMVGSYTAYELCNAAKPFVHSYLFDSFEAATTVYFDSDILLLDSLNDHFKELGEHSFLIVPHLLSADMSFIEEELELIMLWCGVFNAGFMIVHRCDESLAFLKWWQKRLRCNCIHNYGFQEVDQSWLNFVPSLFPGAIVSKNPALNIAYWNLSERRLSLSPDGFVQAGASRATFFHFSGWDFRKPQDLSRHQVTRHVMNSDEKKAWAFLSSRYEELLRSAGVEETSQWPYSFNKANNGEELTLGMRRNYLQAVRAKGPGSVLPHSIFETPAIYRQQSYCEQGPFRRLIAACRKLIANWRCKAMP